MIYRNHLNTNSIWWYMNIFLLGETNLANEAEKNYRDTFTKHDLTHRVKLFHFAFYTLARFY